MDNKPRSSSTISRRGKCVVLMIFVIFPLGLCIPTLIFGLLSGTFYDPEAYKLALNDRPNVLGPKLWNPLKVLSRGHGRLPFPVEVTDGLPNAVSVVSDCKRDLDYIFFFHSALENYEHRTILRHTIGKRGLSPAYNWTTVFFVGLSGDTNTSSKIETEATEHGDMVVLPYRDTYRNLTYKFVYGLKWVIEFCPGIRYVVKLDDDVAINLVKLKGYLHTAPESQSAMLHCMVHYWQPVQRDNNSKYYVSEDLYPKNVFPWYCSGMAVVFRSKLLWPLYNATFYSPYHSVDDAFVTGDAALVAGIGHVDMSSKFSQHEQRSGQVVAGSLIFCHISNPELRKVSLENISMEFSRTFPVTSS